MSRKSWRFGAGLATAAIVLPLLLSACSLVAGTGGAPSQATPGPTAPGAGSAASEPPPPLKPLKLTPDSGPVGIATTITGGGLRPNQPVDLFWMTVDGSFDMKATSETIEYYDRKYTPRRAPLGTATTDSEGRLNKSLNIPEDHGGTHDIVAAVGGKDVARGGFSVVRIATISPAQGPIGTPITIEVKGIASGTYVNTLAVLYDNSYAGFVSAVTTHGTARARLRASGPVGKHTIRAYSASAAVPYLNANQGPYKTPQFEFEFTVTADTGAPARSVEWPETSKVKMMEGTVRTSSGSFDPAPVVKLQLSETSGPILSKTKVTATGLPADADVDILWATAKGNRVTSSGWNVVQRPVGKAKSARDGSLTTEVSVPDDLGGWHMIRLAQGEKLLAETPYYVERSLVSVSPLTVKAGEKVTIQLKGVGWTELDNTVAITYDNSYIGYACGFNSQGDVTVEMIASGQPGTHLIDIYPTIFLGHGKGPWDYNLPQLTFAQDHPSLALGYRIPAIRVAITVVE